MVNKLRIAFSLGYFLSVVKDYFSFVSVKGVVKFDNSRTVRKSLDLFLNFGKDYHSLFGEEIILFPDLNTSEKIIEYFECVSEYITEKIQNECSAYFEIAFFLGGLFGISELSGPFNYDEEKFVEIFTSFLDEIGTETEDFNISEIIMDLHSYNSETRKHARDTILFLIFEDEFVFSKIKLISGMEKLINNSVF